VTFYVAIEVIARPGLRGTAFGKMQFTGCTAKFHRGSHGKTIVDQATQMMCALGSAFPDSLRTWDGMRYDSIRLRLLRLGGIYTLVTNSVRP